ncbi:MAG TPA: hypothetical protein VMT52_07180 [Planctomycetota bacterium]|nr:hypothetical protein [Planctomycetota bacterium]
MRPTLFLVALLLILRPGLALPPGAARAATLSFSTSAGGGTFPGTVIAKGEAVSIDLSGLPTGVDVTRAILRVKRDPPTMSGTDNSALRPIVIRAAGDGPAAAPLPLRAPRFLDFDATATVRAALRSASPSRERRLVLQVESFQGWKPDATRLDVTLVPPAPAGPREGADALSVPRASEVRAWHRSGQTFITWRGPETAFAAATIKEVKAAIAKAAEGAEVRYRIYRAPQPISSASIARADLIDEVDGFTQVDALHVSALALLPLAPIRSRPSRGRDRGTRA